MEVARRGGETAVAEQALDRVHINTAFEQVRGKRVAQRMDTARLGDAGAVLGGMKDAMGRVG